MALLQNARFFVPFLACALAAVAAVTASACGSDNFTSENDAATDAGADTAEDASGSDAASDAVACASGTWCDCHPHAFCEDFDKGDFDTSGKWVPSATNGLLSLSDAGGAPSGPYALRVEIPIDDAGSIPHSPNISHSFPGQIDNFRCEFDFNLVQIDPTSASYMSSAALAITGAADYSSYEFRWLLQQSGGDELGVYTNGPGGAQTEVGTYDPEAAWGHYSMWVAQNDGGVDAGPAVFYGQRDVDPAPIIVLPLATDVEYPAMNSGMVAVLGLTRGENGSTGWVVLYDNFFCDF